MLDEKRKATMSDDKSKNAKILIVDDQESNLAVLEKLLKKKGYENFKSLTDPRRVVPTFQEWQPDLILLDLMMPNMDGFAVMEALKPLIPAEDYLPILVLTADAFAETKQRALSSGAMDFLSKPFDVVEVMLRIENLLQTRALHRQLQNQNATLEERVFKRTAQLSESKMRNHAMLEAIPDLMFLNNQDGVYLDYHADNPKDLLISPEEFMGKTIREVLPPELADVFMRNIQSTLETGKKHSCEYALTLEGNLAYFEARFARCGSRDVMMMARNITERKRAEQLVQALNAASLEMERALSREEIFNGLQRELKKLDFSCMIYLVDETEDVMYMKYFSLPPGVVKAIGAMVGKPIPEYKISVDSTDMSRRIARGRETCFTSNPAEEIARLLPVGLNRFADEIAKLLNLPKIISAPMIIDNRVSAVFALLSKSLTKEDAPAVTAFANQLAAAWHQADLFEQARREIVQRKQAEEELFNAFDSTIRGWSHAMDLRDKETEGHTLRVTEITMNLARAAGLTEAELVHVRRGALLHDIGKIGVPDGILLKPDKLTDDEWVIMRQHPQFGYEMISPIAYLKPALDIPYCHHEKWDGTGYPRGLKGEQIPLAARLFALVDVWDALTSDRPYRAAWSKEEVTEHIQSLSGTHFEPKAVELFLKVMSTDEKNAD